MLLGQMTKSQNSRKSHVKKSNTHIVKTAKAEMLKVKNVKSQSDKQSNDRRFSEEDLQRLVTERAGKNFFNFTKVTCLGHPYGKSDLQYNNNSL